MTSLLGGWALVVLATLPILGAKPQAPEHTPAGAGEHKGEELIERLLRAHEATIASLHRVWARAELQVPDKREGWKTVLWLEWAKDGSLERFRTLRPSPEPPGRPTLESDVMFRGDQVWEQHLRLPPSAPPTDPKRDYRYFIEPTAGRDLPHPCLPSAVLLRLSDPRGNFRSAKLRDVVRSLAGNIKAQVHLAGPNRYVIRLRPADPSRFELKEVEIELDGEAGYLVRRIVWRMPAGLANGPNREWEQKEEVKRFESDGQGAFLPVEVESISTAADPPLRARVVVTDFALNSALPQGALDFRIPAGTTVAYYDSPDGKPRIAYWGPDNKPERFFNSPGELAQFLKRRGIGVSAEQRVMARRVLIAAVFVGVTAALLWLARRKKQRESSGNGRPG